MIDEVRIFPKRTSPQKFLATGLVNPTRLPLLCRNFRAVALAEPGLTAGWLADEIRVNFEFLKFIIDRILNFFAAFIIKYGST